MTETRFEQKGQNNKTLNTELGKKSGQQEVTIPQSTTSKSQRKYQFCHFILNEQNGMKLCPSGRWANPQGNACIYHTERYAGDEGSQRTLNQ